MDYIFDYVSAYRDNPCPETLGPLLTCGIKAMKSYYGEDFNDLTVTEQIAQNTKEFIKDPIARYLGLCVIYNRAMQQVGRGVLKTAQAEILRAIYKTYPQYKLDLSKPAYADIPPNPLDTAFVKYVKNKMVESTNTASESIVTACAPIVPYVGTLSKPFAKTNLATANEMIGNSVTSMEKLIEDPGVVLELIRYPDLLCTEKADTVPAFMYQPTAVPSGRSPQYVEFCKHSYLIHNPQIVDNGAYENIRKVEAIEQTTFGEALESMLKLVPEAVGDNEILVEDLDPNYSRFEKDAVDNFDLTALMNYILSHKRFRANHWTNSGYGNIPHLGSVTFWKGFMLIRPADADGTPVDYLYVPVVDDLSGSKVIIIKYWMDGRIEILTQDQYAVDINATVEEEQVDPDKITE